MLFVVLDLMKHVLLYVHLFIIITLVALISINKAKVENVINFNYLKFMLGECLSWNANYDLPNIDIVNRRSLFGFI